MCFVFGLSFGSLLITTAPVLLLKIIGTSILIESDVIKLDIHQSCFAHLLIAMNAASVVDCATTNYFFVVQEIGILNRVIT